MCSSSLNTCKHIRPLLQHWAGFYVMRRSDQHLEFDLDLAKAQSNDNPVYYVQYAHARICSVLRQMHERKLKVTGSTEAPSIRQRSSSR